MSADGRRLLSVAEAATLLAKTEQTAYRWLKRGELPGAVRLGGRWYVRRTVLEGFLDGANDAVTTGGDKLRLVG